MATKRRGSGEGSVFYDDRRERWVALLELGRDGTGRRRRVLRVGQTKADAVAKLRTIQTKAAAGDSLRRDNRTVADAVDDFVAHGLPPQLSPNARYNVEYHAAKLEAACGAYRLDKLSVRAVEDWLGSLAADGYSQSIVRRSRGVAARVIDHATRVGWLPLERRNVASLARMPQTKARTERYTPDDEAVRRLLGAAAGEHWQPLLAFIAVTGVRIGEACGLAWDDVDLDRGTARIRHAVRVVPGGSLALTEPKSGSSRTVALGQELGTALRAHRLRIVEAALADGRSAPETAFPNRAGGLADPNNLRRWLRGVAKRAGVPINGFHALRHGVASALQDRGESPLRVAGLLGHRNVATTTGTYTHPVQLVADAGLAREGQLLGGKGA
jgi:integrase